MKDFLYYSCSTWLKVTLCLIMLCSIHTPTADSQPDFQAPVAIINATVIPQPGVIIDNGTVLMEGSQIIAVGTKDDVKIPDHAEIIDAQGLFVYAGFIDSATRIGIKKKIRDQASMTQAQDTMPAIRQTSAPYMAIADRSGVRPEFRARDLYMPKKDTVQKHRKAGFTNALIVPHAGILAGSSALVSLGDLPLRQSFLVNDFAQHAGFKTGGPNSWTDPDYPGTIMGSMAQFRQAMLDARWYTQMQTYSQEHPNYRPRILSDPTLESLQVVLAGKQALLFHANDANAILRSIKLANEFNAKLIIAGATGAWEIKDELKQQNISIILSLKFPDEPYPEDKKKKYSSDKDQEDATEEQADIETKDEETIGDEDLTDKEWEKNKFETKRTRDERHREWLEHVHNAIELEKAGIAFSLGSWELKNPEELLKQLRKVIEEGLSSDTALAALTTEPAKLFKQSNSLGTVSTGKLANLSILTAALADEDAKIAYVFVEGIKTAFDYKDKDDGDDKDEDDKDDEKEEDNDDENKSSEDDDVQWPDFATETKADRKVEIKTNGSILLKNATILTVSNGRLENSSILVQNGKITKIGKNLQGPADTMAVDLDGYYIMPGIIDPHSHMGTTGGLNEWTMSVTPEVRVTDIINHKDLAFHRALAGGVTTVHTMHGSANSIGGQNALLRLKYLSSAENMLFPNAQRTIKFATGENVTQKNWQASHGKRFPNSRMGVEFTMREAFRQAKVYKENWANYKSGKNKDVAPPRRDLRLEALVEILDGELWVHTHCYRADEILRLLNVAEDNNFRIAVLQHILEGYRIMPEIARHGVATSTFSDWWSYKVEAINAIPHNAAMMSKYGINATINSDSAEVGRHMNLEAAKSIRFGGLNETEALRLITLNGAIQLDIDDKVGSIEIGKDADLAIFNGHPLDTFAINVMTLIEGEIYFKHRDLNIQAPAKPKPTISNFTTPPEILSIANSKNGKYAIVGATIHPISRDAIENGTLIIENGTIKAIGNALPIDDDTVVVKAQGLHVYPGMINAATTLGMSAIDSIAATNDQRELGRFTPQLRASSAVDSYNIHFNVTRAEGVTTALSIPQGGIIPGQSALLHMNGWTMPDMLIADGVALPVSLPTLGQQIYKKDEKQKEKLKKHLKNLDGIHDYFDKAKRYAVAKKNNNADLTVQADLESMIPYVTGEKPVIFSANSYKAILNVIRFAEKHELKPIIRGGRGAWKLADTLAEKNIPVIITSTFAYPGNKHEQWDSNYRNAGLLAKAGVKFCFGTEGSTLAKQLPILAGMSVAHGLDQDQAMRALTLSAAEIFGINNTLGSLDEGKVADIIISTGNPCQASTKVLGEFIAGQNVELKSIHTDNYEKFMARPDPNLEKIDSLNGPPSMNIKK